MNSQTQTFAVAKLTKEKRSMIIVSRSVYSLTKHMLNLIQMLTLASLGYIDRVNLFLELFPKTTYTSESDTYTSPVSTTQSRNFDIIYHIFIK